MANAPSEEKIIEALKKVGVREELLKPASSAVASIVIGDIDSLYSKVANKCKIEGHPQYRPATERTPAVLCLKCRSKSLQIMSLRKLYDFTVFSEQ